MGTIIDLIGSLIFGGALMMIIIDANGAATQTQEQYSGDMAVQQSLTDVVSGVESEFRNMGFGVPEGDRTILYADTSHIRFVTKLERNTTKVDTIEYTLGPTSELAGTQNDQDRFLKRSVNGEAPFRVGVVTVFRLQYFSLAGDTLTTPVTWDCLSEIHVIEVTMEVQNPYAMRRDPSQIKDGERDALYSSSLWQQTRLASQNSRR